MFGFGWKKRSERLLLFKRAEEALQDFERQKLELTQAKEKETMRQVELWSLLTPTDDLEHEYKMVSADAAFNIKKIMCLEAHINNLRVEKYHCQNGSCERLRELLDIPDPCVNITSEVPQVKFP